MTDIQVCHVTLMVPGLFGSGLHADAEVCAVPQTAPALLTTLLARADRRTNPATGFEPRLFQLFGIHANPDQDLPIAAVTRVADMGIVDNDWWIRADPVHLEPQRAGLVLERLTDLTQDEADRLVTELNDILKTDGWLLKAPRPLRWYLKPNKAPALTTTPLRQVAGQDIHPHLPQGPDRKAWHTRLNELQILLHTSTVNATREARGQKTANSLWFWGGGCLPESGQCPWDNVLADDAVSQGLSRLLSVTHQRLPSKVTTWSDGFDHAQRTLIVLNEISEANENQDLHALAENWLRPLTRAVHKGSMQSLVLLSETGPEFHYCRKHRWFFWRRPRAMENYGSTV